MRIVDLRFHLLDDGNVSVVVRLAVPLQDTTKQPFVVELAYGIDYSDFATAALLVALAYDGLDDADLDDDGTLH